MNHSAPFNNPPLATFTEFTYHTQARWNKAPRRMRLKHFAAASVVPGALLLMIVIAIKFPAESISLVVTGILGLVLTLMLGGIAYAIVDTTPRIIQSKIASAISVVVNVAYLAMIGVFVLL